MKKDAVSILVVDDDEAKRYAIVRLLRSHGFQVSEVSNGADALRSAQSCPDLVVLDVKLPDMSGFDICRELKRNHATAGILVLHMSATLVDPRDRVTGLDAGADGYLTDAVDSHEFLATIRALLRTRDAERNLRETERQFELLVRSVDEYAIFTCDATGTITSWNEGVQRIFGYGREQFLNHPYGQVFASGEDARNDLEAARRSGKAVFDRWIERGDGTQFFATGSVSAIQDDGGEVAGFVNIVRDVTTQKHVELERARLLAAAQAARQEAERVNRIKDEFLATLSHELRTPLSAILGWTQLLKTDKLSMQEFREGIAVIDRNARAQAQLIEDLLDVSRIISGKLQLNIEKIDVGGVISAAVASVQSLADAKQIDIQQDCDANVGTIPGDPTRVQQILWNLLSNAVKFSSRGGKILVQMRRQPDHIEISVTDYGEGIAPEFLPYAFDRFRQADASTTRVQGGLGLGLSIVRHLTELHGGIVGVHSAGKGLGSTFRVQLPTVSSVVTAADDPVMQPRPIDLPLKLELSPDLSGMSFLVVEDDSDARDLMRRIFESCGATVRLASNAVDGIGEFAAQRPDFLVSDIGMPVMDGYEFIRRIRELEGSTRHPVPAIALTAFAQSDDRRRALRSGFQMHVPKPILPGELLAVVASLCSKADEQDLKPAS